VGLAHVRSVDDVAAVDDSRDNDQLVNVLSIPILVQSVGDIRAGVTAKHGSWTHVTGVATCSRHILWAIAESVVVVPNRDHRRRPDGVHRASPRALKGIEDVAKKALEDMGPLGGVAEVTQSKVPGATAPGSHR